MKGHNQARFIIVIIALLFIINSNAEVFSPKDSVGTEKKGNKILVLHKVSSGESLSVIARKYKTSVSEILAENDIKDQKIKIDQIIKVPYVIKKNKITPGQKMHTVVSGDNLSKIAQKYKVSSADLRRWNNLTEDKVKIDRQLIVSGTKASKSEIPDKEIPKQKEPRNLVDETKINTDGQKVYIIKSGESLYKVSTLYKVSVDDLKKWNNLDSDEISIGQELLVEPPGKSDVNNIKIVSPDKPIPDKITTTKKESDRDTVKADKTVTKKTEKITVTKKEEKETGKNNNKEVDKKDHSYVIKNENGMEKIIETGMAEMIDDPGSNDMFLALHRTASVGTVIQVRNLMNDQSVFVRVVGKLPDTGANDKLIVKISKRAYDRLSAIDRRFRVEVSSFPQ